MTSHRKPDIVMVNKNERTCMDIGIECVGDNRIKEKEGQINNYYDLKSEIRMLWSMRRIRVIPIVFGISIHL